MIEITGLDKIDAFCKAVALQFAQMDRDISKEFADWTLRVLQLAAENTPQFSSDTVRNWNYSVNTPDLSYSESPFKYEFAKAHSLAIPFHRGDEAGVQYAMERARQVPQPTWHDTVFIANATPAADLMEAGRVNLRPVNLIPVPQIMIDYVLMAAQTGALK